MSTNELKNQFHEKCRFKAKESKLFVYKKDTNHLVPMQTHIENGLHNYWTMT